MEIEEEKPPSFLLEFVGKNGEKSFQINPIYKDILTKSFINEDEKKKKPTSLNGKYLPLRVKKIVRTNGNNICFKCGFKTKIVHHIDNNPVNNKLDNLQLLCYTCHNKLHHNKI